MQSAARDSRRGGHESQPSSLSKLKHPSKALVDAVQEALQSEQGMFRPPRISAAILALIIELHDKGEPIFTPERTRQEVADLIGCSIHSVDAVLSTRTDEGYIQLVVETTQGYVNARRSTRKERFYVPSKALLDVAKSVRK